MLGRFHEKCKIKLLFLGFLKNVAQRAQKIRLNDKKITNPWLEVPLKEGHGKKQGR